ncbi:nf-x1 finger and helicase domain protein [Rutstroemia sp. NJR-2017a WRK4]|nr:nf-x1 finger and helicase domain protein [Rutstroemia sp. NJR-2017a WRK4]
MIPKPNSNTSRFRSPPVDIKKFFEIGLSLIESEDAGIRQHIIIKLAAETGLVIIKTLTEVMDASQENETTAAIFTDMTLPFYRIISHPDVLSSLILESPVDTIYTFLFGPSGRRGLSAFRFTATALSEIILGHSSNDEEVSTNAVASSLAVLDRLIEINQSAQVIDEFTTIVEIISACISENFMDPNVKMSLTRIKHRLNIGSSLPFAQPQPISQSLLSAVFELSQDLPGHLSHDGARHDNDHASIADIRILPTAQEIASLRQEYLPLIHSEQHHLRGLAGLLDRQFRLLREDTVGQLRDAVREEVTRLRHPNHNVPTKLQGQQGVRKLIYHNVLLSRICVDSRRGLQIVAEFDQPLQLKNKSVKQREDWWKGSKLLQVDSLVCFVSSDGKIIFLSVCDPKLSFRGKNDPNFDNKGDIPSLFTQSNRASVLLSLAEYKTEDTIWISNHVLSSKTRQSLVEFPGVLLPSFQPTLQALQKMSQEVNLPFAEIIAPDSRNSTTPVMKPPAYATKREFAFNLDILAGTPLSLTPGRSFDFTKLNGGSTLDEAQQRAVIRALSTELALIQGPPGTGKSYTGGAIIKALLHNRKAASLGPIICLLEHLVKDGVGQVVRLGSRSKSHLLQDLTLHHIVQGVVSTKTEKHDKWKHNQDIGDILGETKDILSGLNDPKSWKNIEAHLMKTHDQHLMELFGDGMDGEGFQEVKGKKGKRFRAVESWLRGAPNTVTSNRPVAQLSAISPAISLTKMSKLERDALYNHWIKERSTQLTNDLINALDSYHNSKSALDKCHKELNVRCLQEAHIIGVTTSGLARNIEILQRVRAKVMLCEEAGEVLEAHTLTAFLPGVEHAILIGDHEQLRPQINNYELQHDNPRGERYALDISLFERLVKPQMGNFQVPLSTLNVQRRMHPSISELVRVPLYPDLQDHPSVLGYPEVDGMRDRLYWLDHREKEDPRPAQAVSLSRTNTFEVNMIGALVSHLVRQGKYGSEDIAVITPYLGQLQKIKKLLASSFEIVVGDRDQEELEAQGLQEDVATVADGQAQVKVQKTTLLDALRIATVDNFQGEEAKVIVVSLVRSNPERNCGFLKTSNRINVLLSRARHGMYIIGNSDTSRHVPMWAEKERIGSAQSSHYAALDTKKHPSKSQYRTILLASPRKAVVLKDVHRDYSVGIHVIICAILHLCTMQFVALSAVQEQRMAASTRVPDLVEIHAIQNAKS